MDIEKPIIRVCTIQQRQEGLLNQFGLPFTNKPVPFKPLDSSINSLQDRKLCCGVCSAITIEYLFSKINNFTDFTGNYESAKNSIFEIFSKVYNCTIQMYNCHV